MDELTTVMEVMTAAPATVTTTTGGGESSTSSKSDPAADEAARRAIEEATRKAKQAAATLEEAKKIQEGIDRLESELKGAKKITQDAQEALKKAREDYNKKIADADKALKAAQDLALACYNMKFEGLMTLYSLSLPEKANSKVNEYFGKNSETYAAIDSEEFNYGKVITEDGTENGLVPTKVEGVTSNGDGGLNKVVTSTVADTTATNPSVTYTLLDYKKAGNGAGFKIEQVKGGSNIWVKNFYWTEVDISNTSTGADVFAYYIDCTNTQEQKTLNTITMVVEEKEVEGKKVKYLTPYAQNAGEGKGRNIFGELDSMIEKWKRDYYIDTNTVTDNEDDKKIDMSGYNKAGFEAVKKAQKDAQDAMNQAVTDEQNAIKAEQIIVGALQKSRDAMVALDLPTDVATANGLDQGNAPVDVTKTIATQKEIEAALPPVNNLQLTTTQQTGEPQPADSQSAVNQQAEGSQAEATQPTGDTKENDESQSSEDAQ